MSQQPPMNGDNNSYQPPSGWEQPNSRYGVGAGNPISPRYEGQYDANQTAPVYHSPVGYASRSSVVAGALGIFLGTFGIHNFYLGRHALGILQLLITLLSFGLLAWVSTLWGLVEGILYLVSNSPRWSYDGNGVPLRQ
ncbi:MAG: TM2 domain-containing protein [Actinomycetaceae bacterium]|nr:TM2 domain-containing protein [Actinomycetaceae bacterium]